MNHILICIGIVLLYLAESYLLGSLVLHFAPKESPSISFRILIGYFCYFLLFQVAALPLKLTLQPLSMLTGIWCACLVAIPATSLLVIRKDLRRQAAYCRSLLQSQKSILAFLLLVILAQVALSQYNGETYALWDQSYYIGDVSTSVYTNTISQYDPYTGKLLKALNSEYLLETYQNHNAVLCQLFGIPALIETRTAESSLTMILASLLYCQFGLHLFPNSKQKGAWLVFFLSLLNLFSFNLCTSAEFLYFRGFEGKTLLAALILPMVFLLFLKIARDPGCRWNWILMFIVISASFGLNMSSIYMLPFALTISLIPLGLYLKKPAIWLRYAICLAPCALYGVSYLLTKHAVSIYTSAAGL